MRVTQKAPTDLRQSEHMQWEVHVGNGRALGFLLCLEAMGSWSMLNGTVLKVPGVTSMR